VEDENHILMMAGEIVLCITLERIHLGTGSVRLAGMWWVPFLGQYRLTLSSG
jgi:hypothetical protein